jgi:hypothetical protein
MNPAVVDMRHAQCDEADVMRCDTDDEALSWPPSGIDERAASLWTLIEDCGSKSRSKYPGLSARAIGAAADKSERHNAAAKAPLRKTRLMTLSPWIDDRPRQAPRSSPSLEMAFVQCEKIVDPLNGLFANRDLFRFRPPGRSTPAPALQQFAPAPSKIRQS